MATRRSLDETRERVLEAATDLLARDDVNFDASAISLIDACRHAGLTTAGSGYKIWPTQDEFREDLMRYVVTQRDAVNERIDQLREVLRDKAPEPGQYAEPMRVGSLANAARLAGSNELRRQFATWLRAHQDAEVRDGYLESQRTMITGLAEVYREVMAADSREMRPDWTVEQLAFAVEAVTEGLAMMTTFSDEYGAGSLERPTGPNGEVQEWNLLGCVVEAITDAFTRPIGPVASK